MGDIKKQRKKYATPAHPWQKLRLEKEAKLRKSYGYKTKHELWMIESELRRIRAQARKLISGITATAEKEKKELLESLYRKGLLDKEAHLDDILGLRLEDLMERRLQTMLVKKQLVTTIGQARQLITHKKVAVGDKIIISPNFIVDRESEAKIKRVE